MASGMMTRPMDTENIDTAMEATTLVNGRTTSVMVMAKNNGTMALHMRANTDKASNMGKDSSYGLTSHHMMDNGWRIG